MLHARHLFAHGFCFSGQCNRDLLSSREYYNTSCVNCQANKKYNIPERAAFGSGEKPPHHIDAKVREYVTNVRGRLPCGASKLENFMTRNTYDFISDLFAIGKATVATKSSINFQWKIEPTRKATSYEWTAKMNIYFFDVFEEPFYTEAFGMHLGSRVDVGTPYALYHSWEDGLPLSGEGSIQL